MIAYVQGILESIEIDRAVVDVGGIGMEVNISASTCDKLPATGENVKLYTYLNVKEDEMSLFGFMTRDEIGMFKLLITVSGIGPKGALSILSVFSTDDLRFAILSGDVKTISKAPGVGKKTAERMVLELKDKISIDNRISFEKKNESENVEALDDSRNDAVAALVALGYSSADSMKAVRNVLSKNGKDIDTEDILKLALKEMM